MQDMIEFHHHLLQCIDQEDMAIITQIGLMVNILGEWIPSLDHVICDIDDVFTK
jgi:hypothetical protein